MEFSTVLTPALPITLELAEGRLTGFAVTNFEQERMIVSCLESGASFAVPYAQARYITPLTYQWMENYYPSSTPYVIDLREDGSFFEL